jgi:hypothetical protein
VVFVRILIIAALGALLSGCLSFMGGGGPRVEQGIWLRSDGQSGRNNPALAKIFDVDRAACTPVGSSEPDRACMSSRGYVLVPASQVEQKAAELRAANAARVTPPVQ